MTHRKKLLNLFIFASIAISLVGCGKEAKKKEVSSEPISFKKSRWYTQQQFEVGKQVFTANCVQCHGSRGQGLVEDWKTPNPNGKFPAPPLNGTAHTWHHSTEVLFETINNGGIPLGGSMPAFKEVLSEEEKLAVIAFVQNLWDNETYERWINMNAKL